MRRRQRKGRRARGAGADPLYVLVRAVVRSEDGRRTGETGKYHLADPVEAETLCRAENNSDRLEVIAKWGRKTAADHRRRLPPNVCKNCFRLATEART